jgi:hypothetical protein
MEGGCYPRRMVYDETLARCTRAVYPPRFFRTAPRHWARVLLWLWLGHMYVKAKDLTSTAPESQSTAKP